MPIRILRRSSKCKRLEVLASRGRSCNVFYAKPKYFLPTSRYFIYLFFRKFLNRRLNIHTLLRWQSLTPSFMGNWHNLWWHNFQTTDFNKITRSFKKTASFRNTGVLYHISQLTVHATIISRANFWIARLGIFFRKNEHSVTVKYLKCQWCVITKSHCHTTNFLPSFCL